MKKFFKYLTVSCAVVVLAAVVLLGVWFVINENFLNNTFVTNEVSILEGASASKVYDDIFSNIDTPFGFEIYINKVKKFGKHIKYGYYHADNISLSEFIGNIMKGTQSNIKVTIPEGFNIFEIASALERMGISDKETFTDTAFNPDIVQSVTGTRYDSMEGFLAPGTYKFPKNYDNVMIIKTMYKEFLR
ncbi:MAG: endolytic transglycosylase MltG, partial [Deferribacterales bacterium]|nr:endolytic transglycosylase MltG [Deferribacterales bacterium]